MLEIERIISYVFSLGKELIDYIPIFPFEVRVIMVGFILSYFLAKEKEPIEQLITWILFTLMFYSTFLFWLPS